MSKTTDLNINELMSCIKNLSKTEDLKNLIGSYSDPNVRIPTTPSLYLDY